jgi:hypothetical protein
VCHQTGQYAKLAKYLDFVSVLIVPRLRRAEVWALTGRKNKNPGHVALSVLAEAALGSAAFRSCALRLPPNTLTSPASTNVGPFSSRPLGRTAWTPDRTVTVKALMGNASSIRSKTSADRALAGTLDDIKHTRYRKAETRVLHDRTSSCLLYEQVNTARRFSYRRQRLST